MEGNKWIGDVKNNKIITRLISENKPRTQKKINEPEEYSLINSDFPEADEIANAFYNEDIEAIMKAVQIVIQVIEKHRNLISQTDDKKPRLILNKVLKSKIYNRNNKEEISFDETLLRKQPDFSELYDLSGHDWQKVYQDVKERCLRIALLARSADDLRMRIYPEFALNYQLAGSISILDDLLEYLERLKKRKKTQKKSLDGQRAPSTSVDPLKRKIDEGIAKNLLFLAALHHLKIKEGKTKKGSRREIPYSLKVIITEKLGVEKNKMYNIFNDYFEELIKTKGEILLKK